VAGGEGGQRIGKLPLLRARRREWDRADGNVSRLEESCTSVEKKDRCSIGIIGTKVIPGNQQRVRKILEGGTTVALILEGEDYSRALLFLPRKSECLFSQRNRAVDGLKNFK
jgi:hypothetical protein